MRAIWKIDPAPATVLPFAISATSAHHISISYDCKTTLCYVVDVIYLFRVAVGGAGGQF